MEVSHGTSSISLILCVTVSVLCNLLATYPYIHLKDQTVVYAVDVLTFFQLQIGQYVTRRRRSNEAQIALCPLLP